MVKGIDVSCWQNKIDWVKVKAAGIEFAMIRAGFGNDASQIDSHFKENIEGALAVGIQVGVTWMSYAVSIADAVKEAVACMKIITPYSGKISFPVAFDWEYASENYFVKQTGRHPTDQEISNFVVSFCKEMGVGCWYACNYQNLDYTFHKLNSSIVKDIDKWLADYVGGPDVPCGMQQTASDGRVDGITTNVDTDIAYTDYPTLIKAHGLNGYRNAPTPASQVIVNSTYLVRAGDCMSSIASAHGMSLSTLLALNPQVKGPAYTIWAGNAIKLSASATAPQTPQAVNYTVQQGDCMSKIASAYGISLSALLALNPQVKGPAYTIWAGQKIKIK